MPRSSFSRSAARSSSSQFAYALETFGMTA